MECSALAPPYILQSRLVCSGLASLVRLFYSAVIVTACLKNSPHPHKTKRRSAKIRRTWQASIIVVIRDVGNGWAGWKIQKISYKGQLISKAIYGLLTSPKKNERRNLFCLLFYSSQQTDQIRSFVFWEKLRLANLFFDFIWPLVIINSQQQFYEIHCQ